MTDMTVLLACGDYWDNESVFHRALFAIWCGHEDEGNKMLVTLRQHVIETQDLQSLRWLLPRIDQALTTFALSEA
jgi:hypothetical protein